MDARTGTRESGGREEKGKLLQREDVHEGAKIAK